MDVDEEMPTLPPEIKINMKLDDIIKYEKMKAGVSHNLQFKRSGHKKKKFFRSYNARRRYKSQNWRLRGNGPNTPRWRHFQSNFQRISKVRAFLEQKCKSAPMNSVFHRLGWNPLQETARAKVWNARNYYRPQRPRFAFQKNYHKPCYDPDRAKKLIKSAQIYNARLGDGLGDLTDQSDLPNTLTELNLRKLNEALGGGITSVKQEESEAGTLTTTITRELPTPSLDGSFHYGNAMNSTINGFNRGGLMNMPSNYRGYAMNGIMGNNCFNGNPMAMNSMMVNSYAHNGYSMNPYNNMCGMIYGQQNQLASNPMYNGGNAASNFSSMNGMGMRNFTRTVQNETGMNQLNRSSATNVNSLSRSVDASSMNENQVIASLNGSTAGKNPTPTNAGGFLSSSTWGKGIDAKVAVIHTTNQAINSRFAAAPLTSPEMED